MPIHDVGYRHWEGEFSSVWLRWVVIAGAGIRLVWKSHWLRRMLFFAWMPAAVTGVGFFIFEQSVEHPEWRNAGRSLIATYPDPQRGSEMSQIQDVMRTFERNPADARHKIWSMLLLAFFRYPQGLLIVLIVGMIAPSLIALDMRSRAYLLYFARPITPFEYILGKALVLWTYLTAVTTLPALVLYILGVLLSPSFSVSLYTWDLPFRILAASMILMLPTTSLALFFSSMTTESRYAGFSWFALWALGWAAYANLNAFLPSSKWEMLSMYHVLGRVQEAVFGLSPAGLNVAPYALLLFIITVMPFVVLATRVIAPMRV